MKQIRLVEVLLTFSSVTSHQSFLICRIRFEYFCTFLSETFIPNLISSGRFFFSFRNYVQKNLPRANTLPADGCAHCFIVHVLILPCVFPSAVIELKTEDRSKFLDALITLLSWEETWAQVSKSSSCFESQTVRVLLLFASLLDVMKLMSCVRHEVSQELYPCFKCFYQFCVHIVQSFCKCVEVLFLLLNCCNICLLFLFMYASASSHFFTFFKHVK